MKVEDKKEIYIGIIKSCFLVLCGVCSYYYINLDVIKSFNDWRAYSLEPIIVVVGFIWLCFFSFLLIRLLRGDKKE